MCSTSHNSLRGITHSLHSTPLTYSCVNVVLTKNWGPYFSAISGLKFDLTTVLRPCWPLKWRRRGFITLSVTFVLFLNCLHAHRLFSCGFLLKIAKEYFSWWDHIISIKLLIGHESGRQHCRLSICIFLISWVWQVLRQLPQPIPRWYQIF